MVSGMSKGIHFLEEKKKTMRSVVFFVGLMLEFSSTLKQ